MKLELQPVLDNLKSKALPILEKDLVIVIDSVLGSVKDQAVVQAASGDAVAGVVSLVVAALQPAIDLELAKLLPDAAKA